MVRVLDVVAILVRVLDVVAYWLEYWMWWHSG